MSSDDALKSMKVTFATPCYIASCPTSDNTISAATSPRACAFRGGGKGGMSARSAVDLQSLVNARFPQLLRRFLQAG
jgi:hypothetical protein